MTAAEPSARVFEAIVGSGAWFRALPAGLRSQLLDAARVRRLSEGDCLFCEGDRGDGLYCVVAGCLRLSKNSADGRQTILALAEPPQWFGEIALFDRAPRSHDAWAGAPTTLLHVPQAPLLALLEADPRLWRPLGLLLTHKLRLAFEAIQDVALLTPGQRLARLIVSLAEHYGQSPQRTKREIRVPQQQLGQMLGLSRQTVNQLLKSLAAVGAIRLARGAIEILDIKALRRCTDH